MRTVEGRFEDNALSRRRQLRKQTQRRIDTGFPFLGPHDGNLRFLFVCACIPDARPWQRAGHAQRKLTPAVTVWIFSRAVRPHNP